MDFSDSKIELPDVSQYEHLLNEVEATEGQLGAILRLVAAAIYIFTV